MATPEDILAHPLTLLVVGAGLSVGLGTWLSHWLENRRKKRDTEVENHKKELEIKVELASKMSELIANGAAEAGFATDIQEKYTEADEEKLFEKEKK